MIYLWILLIVSFAYLFFKYHFESISIHETIELLKEELKNTQVTEMIKDLPWKYHHSYWLNIICLNILNKRGHNFNKDRPFSINIKVLGYSYEYLGKKIRLKYVMSYVNKVLKEKRKYEDQFCKEVNLKDTSIVSELKTISEIENNLPGTVNINDKKLNDKLLVEVRLK